MDDLRIIKFKKNQSEEFNEFRKQYKNFSLCDWYQDMFANYEILKNPKYYFGDKKIKQGFKKEMVSSMFSEGDFFYGNWIVYPQKNKILHLLEQDKYMDFRTLRNRDLIRYEEQNALYNKKILFIGLSVGSQVLLSFVRTGIGNKYRIVDADEIEVHNFNRTNFSLDDVGLKKVNVVKNQIYSIDPYISIEAVEEYATGGFLDSLLSDVDLIVDSFDNFAVKILLRKKAKKLKIPVLSGFDISKGSMVISERYDVDQNLDMSFYLNGFTEKDILGLKNAVTTDKTNLFINIIGRERHDKRMLDSVMRVGKELTGYPQLAVATNLTSALWTTVAIDILLGKRNGSLKYFVNLEEEIYDKLI